MPSVPTIRSADFHVVNGLGTVLFTSDDRGLALDRAKALTLTHGDLWVERVTIREERESIRRVRAPRTERAAA